MYLIRKMENPLYIFLDGGAARNLVYDPCNGEDINVLANSTCCQTTDEKLCFHDFGLGIWQVTFNP